MLFSYVKNLIRISILSLAVMTFSPSLADNNMTEDIEGVSFTDNKTPKQYMYQLLGEHDAKLLDKIISKESGWCHTKWNGQSSCPDTPREQKLPNHSSAYGLCQTMMSIHKDVSDDFMTNPYAQIDWCIKYAKERYKNLDRAWSFWQANKYW